MSEPINEDKSPEVLNEDVGIIEDQHKADLPVVVEKKTIVQQLQSGWKAITSFVVALAGFLTLIVSDPQIREALPEGILSWLIVVGIPFLVGAGTWLKRNEYTVDEAVEILNRAQKRAGK